MNKKRERDLVFLSVIFLILIISTTWIYMVVYSRFMQKKQMVGDVKSEEQKKTDMIGRIQSADENKINLEEKNSMISNIIN
jgi:flagellar basal body-associated protein FliL